MTKKDYRAVVGIDAIRSGKAKPEYWKQSLKPFFTHSESQRITLGYVAEVEHKVIGYILAEGRAWEFGSPLCGWILAIGVDPKCDRQGVGLTLCREICLKFKSLNIKTVRTMVRKDNINLLSFFRASGFGAGPFIELELEL